MDYRASINHQTSLVHLTCYLTATAQHGQTEALSRPASEIQSHVDSSRVTASLNGLATTAGPNA